MISAVMALLMALSLLPTGIWAQDGAATANLLQTSNGGGMTLSASARSAPVDEEITFTVSLSGTAAAKSGSITLSYDSNAFAYVSSRWGQDGALLSTFDPSNGKGVIAFSSARDLNGTYFTFVLEAADASADAETVSASVQLKNGSTTVGDFTASAEVSSGGTCGDDLTWTLDDEGTLTISGTGEMTNWSPYSSVPWYNKCDSIKTVTIPDGVTSIGSYAFYNCRNLTGITIPDSVTSIGDFAFDGCTGLTSITIPDSVTSIGDYAFYSCYGLTSVTIPDGVTSIGNSAFEGCQNLTSITIPDSVTSIGSYAFCYCYNLTDVTMGDAVTSIGDGAFQDCHILTSITIPDSVTSIGNSAFYNCQNLTSVTIGNSVTSIGNSAFYYCYNLTSITIPDGVTSIGSHAFCDCYNLTSITIPDSVTSIGDCAFEGCQNLTSITIPDSVTSIGSYAFYKCQNLTSVAIPTNVTYIGYYAFTGCSNLRAVVLQTLPEEIGENAFPSQAVFAAQAGSDVYNALAADENYSDRLVTGIRFGDAMPTECVEGQAVQASVIAHSSGIDADVTALCELTLPDTSTPGKKTVTASFCGFTASAELTVVDAAAYYTLTDGATRTATVSEPGERVYFRFVPEEDGRYIFRSAANGEDTYGEVWNESKNIQLASNDDGGGNGNFKLSYQMAAGTVYYLAARYLSSDRTGAFPVSLAKMPDTGSGTCGESLTWELVKGGTLTVSGTGEMTDWWSESDVPWYEFRDVITRVVVEPGVTTIGSYAFRNCYNLTDVTLPEGVTDIGESAFCYCYNLTGVTLPDSVATIGSYAFNNCNHLASLEIPEGVVSIGNYAFCYCYNLTDVTMGDAVTSIGDGAFQYCQNLTSITIPDSVTSIGYSAFYQCYNLTDVTLGSGVASIGGYAFAGCHGLTSITIPDGVTSIGADAFYGCSGLRNITVAAGNTTYSSVDGVLFSADRTTLIAYPGGKGDVYAIPEGVTSIGDLAFYGCYNLTDVTIPDSVTSIGDSAFNNCGLRRVTLPAGVKSIGSNAFWSWQLRLLELRGVPEEIGERGFFNPDVTILAAQAGSDVYAALAADSAHGACLIRGIRFADDFSPDVAVGQQPYTPVVAYSADGTETDVTELCAVALPNTSAPGTATVSASLYGFTVSEEMNVLGTADYYALALGVTRLVKLPNSDFDRGCRFTFTPAEDGRYAFVSSNTPWTVCSEIYDSDGQCIATDISSSFRTVCRMAAGVTYTLVISERYINSYETVFPVHVEKLPESGSGDCGENAVWELTADGTLTVSGTGDMWDWSRPWDSFRDMIVHVVIEPGITRIGAYAFDNCYNLTDVAIPDSVTSIGEEAFRDCSALISVTIPEGVTEIVASTFDGCASLTSITIPDGVTGIGWYVFRNCRNLTSVEIPSSVTYIGDQAFRGCTSLTGVTIPEGVESIGSNAFEACASLTGVTIPDSVTELGSWAFHNCAALESVTIGSGLNAISDYTFYGCCSLTSVVIPSGVGRIGDLAFADCTSLAGVEIPDSVTWIGGWAFRRCGALTGVTIPNGVTTIDNNAFEKCSALTSVTIPGSVVSIGDRVFESCNSLESVTIPGSVERMGSGVFSDCGNLVSITVSAGNPAYCSVDQVLFNAERTNLILYPAGKTATTYSVPAGVTGISASAFSGCGRLQSVLLPNSVTTIAYGAFAGCSRLQQLTVPASVTEIGTDAFADCTKLSKLVFEGNAPDMDWGVFRNAAVTAYYPAGDASWENVLRTNHFARSLTWVPYVLMGSCGDQMEYLLAGDGTLTISGTGDMWDGDAFPWSEAADRITQLCVKEGVTGISAGAFADCVNLLGVSLPESLTRIGSSTFAGCSALESIYIPGNVAAISERTFADCTALVWVYIPRGVTDIGSSAFSGCTALEWVNFCGSAPAAGTDCFSGVSATAYYPADDDSWTAEARSAIGATLRWTSNEVVDIEMVDLPAKTRYQVGDTLSLSGMRVDLVYANGDTERLNEGYTAAYDFSTSGEKTVTVSYGEYSVDFRVNVMGIKGDADSDGAVDAKDRTVFSRYLAGWDDYEELIDLSACDINRDGVVNGKDRAIISRYLAGWDGYDRYFENRPLVVGYSTFNGKFSPFFSETLEDEDVWAMTQVNLLPSDRQGAVLLNAKNGETVNYNGTDYTYYGVANCTITEQDDGTVTYDFDMRDDITFSDGEKLTADDVIFTMYVLCDPTYDGSGTLFAQPIVGLEEYRSGMDTLLNLLYSAGRNNTDFTYWTAAEQTAFWKKYDAATTALAEEIVAFCVDNGYNEPGDVAGAAANWGFEIDDNTVEAFAAALEDAYKADVAGMIGTENAGSGVDDLFPDLSDYSGTGITTGASAANIAGIEKTGEYSLRVTLSCVDATAIYSMNMSVVPMHYYGEADKYDYANNQFGFTKGDLSHVRSVTGKPMGAGPYKFIQYTDGVVSFEANASYYRGAPRIQYVDFRQGLGDDEKIRGLADGVVDIAEPSFSVGSIETITQVNDGEGTTGSIITTNTVDNLGYGYLGISAKAVNVGGDIASDASKNLRKAFATVFSVYRDLSVASYYGERASVINYPISNTSWAAPQPSDDGYKVAFSVDVEGNDIYTADMSAEERYAAALDAALGFFEAAGYTVQNGQVVAAPAGAKLEYEIQIPADGIGDHPSYLMVTEAAAALETIGIRLIVTDLANSSELWQGIEGGWVDMWCAAWGATVDPDMYQIYYSDVANGGANPGGSNYMYDIADAELDQMILDARMSTDVAYRKTVYKACLDIIADWAVEVPVYQRQNSVVYSTERIKTMTPDITAFYDWMVEIHTVELK